MRQLNVTTLTDQNISAPLLCKLYTAPADGSFFVRLFLDQIVGGGIYEAWLSIRRLGAGTVYPGERVVRTVRVGETAATIIIPAIPIQATDLIWVYVLGQPGDTTTVDIITELWAAGWTMDTVWTAAKAAYLDEAISAAKTLTAGTITSIRTGLSTLSAQQVWTYITRKLTESPRTGYTAETVHTIRQTAYWSDTVDVDLTSYANVYYAIKASKDDDDDEALIMIDSDTGLLTINGAAATGHAAWGSITLTATEATIELLDDATALLAANPKAYWEIRGVNGDGQAIYVQEGEARILVTTIKATS